MKKLALLLVGFLSTIFFLSWLFLVNKYKRADDKIVVATYANLLGENPSNWHYVEPIVSMPYKLEKTGFLQSFYKHIDVVLIGPGSHKSEILRKFIARNSVSIYFTGEPNSPQPKNYDLSMGFDYLDDDNYLRYPLYFEYFADKLNLNYKRERCQPNKKKYFACFLYRNGAAKARGDNGKTVFADGIKARKDLFDKLQKYKFVASGGKYLNNINYFVPYNETMTWLSNCKFVIAFESRAKDGYVSEKMPQAYFAGALPIYYGSPSYHKDVNRKAVIYQGDFKNQDELVEYIKKVDQDDKLYCDIYNQPLIVKKEQTYDYKQTELRKKYDQFVSNKLKL